MCKICQRKREENSEYCSFHQKAYNNLQKTFKLWSHALNINWLTYLREVSVNPATGDWAKEVAEEILNRTNERTDYFIE